MSANGKHGFSEGQGEIPESWVRPPGTLRLELRQVSGGTETLRQD
jgi:hypothetical protein